MIEWWKGLTSLNQAFYAAAGFFSLVFLWQFIASIIGLTGEGLDMETEVDTDIDVDGGLDLDDIEAHSLEEAAETTAAFKILSLRAVLAFCTMFSWASAMYLDLNKPLTRSLIYASCWGVAGWILVALMVNWMRHLAETGTQKLSTCVGKAGTVYLNIPAGGEGEVRAMVSGRITLVKARAAGGGEINSGTPVRVVRMLDSSTVEVKAREGETKEREGEK